MTDPISSENRSVYEPPSGYGGSEACDPSLSSCAPLPATPGNTVSTAPVYITGDSGAGARELVRRQAAASPSCAAEVANAAVSCLLAGSAAGATVVAAPTGVGLALGAATTAGLAAQCSRDVLAARDCKENASSSADNQAACDAQGGEILLGAHGNPVCLTP